MMRAGIFDSASLSIGLGKEHVARWKPSKVFSYGYARFESLGDFVNGVVLTVVSCKLLWEAVHKLHKPPHDPQHRTFHQITAWAS